MCDITPLNIHSFIINLSVHESITTYISDIFRILNIYHHCTITVNIICIINTQKHHIKTQGFNMVHPNLGYVHNDWLLILFIYNLLTVVHCAYKKMYQLTLPKPASVILLQCEPNSQNLSHNSKHSQTLSQFFTQNSKLSSSLTQLIIKKLLLPKNPLQFIALQ
jgi:hypothetical protein